MRGVASNTSGSSGNNGEISDDTLQVSVRKKVTKGNLLYHHHLLMGTLIETQADGRGPVRGGSHVPRLNFTGSYVAVSDHSRVAFGISLIIFLARCQSGNLLSLQRCQRNLQSLYYAILLSRQ